MPGIDSADVTLGFKDAGGKIDFYGDGKLGTKVKGADLSLVAKWKARASMYSAGW
jgi:poly(A) polymerase Pap1